MEREDCTHYSEDHKTRKRIVPWNRRPLEVRNLLNPAFCGRILYTTVSEYQLKTDSSFPFPLIYLILPLVLTESIRNVISSRTQLTNWVQKHPELLVGFGRRAGSFVTTTNEALEFMLQTEFLILTDDGKLSLNKQKRKISKSKYIDPDIKECLKKAEHVGRWFADTGKVETIYICLGVRP